MHLSGRCSTGMGSGVAASSRRIAAPTAAAPPRAAAAAPATPTAAAAAAAPPPPPPLPCRPRSRTARTRSAAAAGEREPQGAAAPWPCFPRSAARRTRTAAAAADEHLTSAAGDREQPGSAAPWSITFDLRERETIWTDANKARLVALVAAQKSCMSLAEFEPRLEQLVALLPDLATHMPSLHPQLIVDLAADLGRTTDRVLALRQLLPAANVSAMVAAQPQLLLQEPAALAGAVAELQELLGLPSVDRLVEQQPLFLDTRCVRQALGELSRLMPAHVDAAALLVADPSWLLKLQRGPAFLGEHPDSVAGEQITWEAPSQADSGSSSSRDAGGPKSDPS